MNLSECAEHPNQDSSLTTKGRIIRRLLLIGFEILPKASPTLLTARIYYHRDTLQLISCHALKDLITYCRRLCLHTPANNFVFS